MLTRYRYTLQPYAGPASRYTCPSCDKTRAFTRYLDTRTGELLEVKFGKCDRNDKCGYHLSPYHPSSGLGSLSHSNKYIWKVKPARVIARPCSTFIQLLPKRI